MSYLVSTTDKGGAHLYVRTAGRKGVTFTPDREKARRFRRLDTAQSIRDVIRLGPGIAVDAEPE